MILSKSLARTIALIVVASIGVFQVDQSAMAKVTAGKKTTNVPVKKSTEKASDSGGSHITLTGGVDVLTSACTQAGLMLESPTLPTTVLKVRIGSSAYYGGLEENDRVLEGKVGNDNIHLVIERAKKVYALNVRYTPDNLYSELVKEEAKVEATKNEAKRLVAKADWDVLNQYDMVILQDCSASMLISITESLNLDVDDTARPTKGSIWYWCNEQLQGLAQEANAFSGSFTFCPFSDTYKLVANCTSATIKEEMDKFTPGGDTVLEDPLDEILKAHLAKPKRKPLLVVVVTDGLLCQNSVDEVLIGFCKKLKSQTEAKIIFLQVGMNPVGPLIVSLFDSKLVTLGAPFDIVSSAICVQLDPGGLRHGLVTAVRKPLDPTKASESIKAEELKKVREELAQLRESSKKTGPAK